MRIEDLIARVKGEINALAIRYNELTEQINNCRSAETPDTVREDALVAERGTTQADLVALRAKLAIYEAEAVEIAKVEREQAMPGVPTDTPENGAERTAGGASGVEVREQRTYTRDKDTDGVASFFVDAYRASMASDYKAQERLQRHMREVEVHGELTKRAQTTGGASALVIPQYLVDQLAIIVRAGRPLADSLNHWQLPATGMSIIVPRQTTGAAVASQATENTAVVSTDEVFANLTVPVVTIAGQQDVSRQLIERGSVGIDQIIYADLASAYMTELDRQVVQGTGASNQMLGITATAGVGQATAFTAAATVATFYSKLLGSINDVEVGRFMAPSLIVMHPRRWNWLLAQMDTSGRPIALPNMNFPMNAIGSWDAHEPTPASTPSGVLAGLPVITDANVPTAVGTGPEDVVIVTRKEDLILWEDGDGMPRELRFEQTLGNQLTVKLVAYGYAAFTAGRYPAAVSKVGGNAGTAGYGLIAPTF